MTSINTRSEFSCVCLRWVENRARKREELLNVAQQSNVKLFNFLVSVSPAEKGGHLTASLRFKIERV